jgi:hypothetical protein
MTATNLHTSHPTPEPELMIPKSESYSDRVYTMSSMTGAACGAVVGVGVAATAAVAFMPAVMGLVGIVSGSVLGSAVGRFVILPLSRNRA